MVGAVHLLHMQWQQPNKNKTLEQNTKMIWNQNLLFQ
jgi:hypothetical protein